MDQILEPEALGAFPEEARRAVYECIGLRRDVRHFKPEMPVDSAVLTRILEAAHQAPSVGHSQPWGFVLLVDTAQRERIRQSFLKCREAEAARFPSGRRAAYLAHKLEGIREAPLNLCVTVDLRDRGEAILGTTAQPEALRASVCCAVQNLWLAARVEGIGVGWVSIVEPAVLRQELELPPGVEPVAYLCLGHPVAFRRRPMLEETGWQARAPVSSVIHPAGTFRHPRKSEPPPWHGALENEPILPPCATAANSSREHQQKLAKPVGSLGRLEELAAFYAAARGTYPPPSLEQATLLLFAADHGVVAEGVSAYGSQLTSAVVANVMAGGAAVNAIAREQNVSIELYDVGIAGDLSAVPRDPVVRLSRRAVRAGSRNLCREPALTRGEVERALAIGEVATAGAVASGAGALGIGEIGIGNTTAAAALVAAFCGISAEIATGGGTGVEGPVLERKRRVVAGALALHQPDPRDALGTLAALGGLEIVALVGAMLGAARRRVPVVLDGFITHAAALAAVALEPELRGYLLVAHASTEPGARHALEHLGLEPLLDLRMRLGEGTGACLALGLLRTAVALERGMATFATAGIVGRTS